MDNGTRRRLIPLENKRQFLSIGQVVRLVAADPSRKRRTAPNGLHIDLMEDGTDRRISHRILEPRAASWGRTDDVTLTSGG
jgi:hypothetical protein